MIDISAVRKQFPILGRQVHGKPLVYLDNAATTLKPQRVIDSINLHYSQESANIHRGVHYLSELGTQKYEATRLAIQNFINARHSHEVLMTKGTTDSLNLVAYSYGQKFVKAGDVILLSTMEHHSNIVPWQMMAERHGAVIEEIPVTDDGAINEEAFKKLLATRKVRLVSMCWISNSLGTINPVKKYIKWVHEVGGHFVVDGAQAASHASIDVQDLDCDFLAFSGHKMFGPTGIGILYGKENLLEQMPPYQGGGDMIDKVTIKHTTYNELPHKFEAGTPPIASGIGLKAAVEFIQELGIPAIEEYEKELLAYATAQIKQFKDLRLIGTAAHKSSVLAFSIPGVHPHDLGTLLDQQGVAIRTGHHCTQPLMQRFGVPATSRASFSVYNTKEEIDYFITALRKCRELL
jgi:cysteine desulfurase/selenocysteine lyase